jgi:acetylornithine aminotransferase
LETLQAKLAGNPLVHEVRGQGMLIGIDCKQSISEVITEIHKQGVMVITAGPNVIRLAPSLAIPKEDLEKGLEIICSVLANKASTAVL